jgi:dephospho-CoA kinase
MILPLKIGITGGIGAGKSMVCKVLENMGYPVFYSDLEAKIIMNNHPEVRRFLIERVGANAYVNGELNRVFLAERFFSNPELLADVNRLVHPLVRKSFADFAKNNETSKLVFNEAAILFETGAFKQFDAIVLVTANEQTRIRRVMNRDGIGESEVIKRMSNQWSDEQKRALTEFEIDNNEDSHLLAQVEEVVVRLLVLN